MENICIFIMIKFSYKGKLVNAIVTFVWVDTHMRHKLLFNQIIIQSLKRRSCLHGESKKKDPLVLVPTTAMVNEQGKLPTPALSETAYTT